MRAIWITEPRAYCGTRVREKNLPDRAQRLDAQALHFFAHVSQSVRFTSGPVNSRIERTQAGTPQARCGTGSIPCEGDGQDTLPLGPAYRHAAALGTTRFGNRAKASRGAADNAGWLRPHVPAWRADGWDTGRTGLNFALFPRFLRMSPVRVIPHGGRPS